MKYYAKPSLEVISMKTSENIADNLIKTLYEDYGTGFQVADGAQEYNSVVDLGGSVVNS